MYRNFKIVVNTAAGRRRYMQYLIPFIVTSKIVDRYDIWINTHNMADIEFFKRMAMQYPMINLVWQPEGIVDGNKSINAFYKQCVDDDTIYFKLDDDIIWMEPNAIQSMVDFRIDNPAYFLVTPLVINNALSTYLLEISGKIHLSTYYSSNAMHPILWESGEFASQLHQWFVKNYISGAYKHLHIGKHEMSMTRFSINAILWFGKEMKRFAGIVPGDDEEFLSCIYPSKNGLSNCWNGDVIVSHFAFYTQREQLDRKSILEQYGNYLLNEWSLDASMKEVSDYIQSTIRDIQKDESRYNTMLSPYQHVKKNTHSSYKRMKQVVKQLLPLYLNDIMQEKKKKNTLYILG